MSQVVSFLICNKHERNDFLTGLFEATPAEAPLFARKSALRNPVTARGATAKAAAAKAVPEEPLTKRFKGTERDLPEALVAVQKNPGAILEALGLVSSFHVNEIGLHETWLGCGLLVEWTAHADYPTGALTVELVEQISRYQGDGGDPEAAQALEAKQRAVLAGLLSFEKALELYTEAYLLCVKACKDIHKDEISKLLGLATGGAPPFEPPGAEKIP